MNIAYYNLWTILIQWLFCFFIHIIQKCEQDQENCIEYKLRTRCFILSGLLDCFDKSGNFFITICTYKFLYILSEID